MGIIKYAKTVDLNDPKYRKQITRHDIIRMIKKLRKAYPQDIVIMLSAEECENMQKLEEE